MKLKKIFLIESSALDKLYNDITHNSVRWTYGSAKIDWTKNSCWAYNSSHNKVDGNKNRFWNFYAYKNSKKITCEKNKQTSPEKALAIFLNF